MCRGTRRPRQGGWFVAGVCRNDVRRNRWSRGRQVGAWRFNNPIVISRLCASWRRASTRICARRNIRSHKQNSPRIAADMHALASHGTAPVGTAPAQVRPRRRFARRSRPGRDGRAVVAAVQRSDRARYRDAVADRGDQGKFRRAATTSRSAAPSSSATPTDARRCAFATSWCATPKAPWWRARRRRKSASPARAC